MITVLLDTPTYRWLDVIHPSTDELKQIAADYQLHWVSVEDCLQPMHMPKFERFSHYSFLMLRVYDEKEKQSNAYRLYSIRKFTRKLAIFFNDHWLISIHSHPLEFCPAVAAQYRDDAALEQQYPLRFALIKAALRTFEYPLDQVEQQAEHYEKVFLNHEDTDKNLKNQYQLQYQTALIKRLLWHILSALKNFHPLAAPAELPLYRDIEETCESHYFHAERLLEDLQRLMELHLALSSQRTNKIVKVLTLFSVFFMPPTFIVGVYGMNFVRMPELHWTFGYPLVWLVLLLTVGANAWWFWRQKWW